MGRAIGIERYRSPVRCEWSDGSRGKKYPTGRYGLSSRNRFDDPSDITNHAANGPKNRSLDGWLQMRDNRTYVR